MQYRKTRTARGRILIISFLLIPAVLQGCGKSGPQEITAGELEAHVSYLASDALEGREAGSAGVAAAERYIAEYFSQAGLSPLPGNDGYFLPFSLYRKDFDLSRTYLRFELPGGERRAEAGKDFLPTPFSDEGSGEGSVVFAGYGITAPEYGYDDYAGLEVKGKYVLVLRHEPNENDPDSRFKGRDMTDHALFTRKAQNAASHGAKGMLLVTDPLNHPGPEDLRLRPLLFLSQNDADRPNRSRKNIIPSFLFFQISRELADEVIGSAEYSLADLQREVDRGVPPAELAVREVSAKLGYGGLTGAGTISARNVAAFIPGSDPELSHEWIVVGAHHDHIGSFAKSGPPSAGDDTIYNGADDNASGTSSVLEIAESFAKTHRGLKRSVLFITFSAEEEGLLGSRAFLEQQVPELLRRSGADPLKEKIVFMVNLDMVGRNPDKPVEVYGDGFEPGVRTLVEENNGSYDVPLSFHGTDYEPASDHDTFYRRRIPFLFFFTGLHEDYHQVSDHAAGIVYDRLAVIDRLVYDVVRDLASLDELPAFTGSVRRTL